MDTRAASMSRLLWVTIVAHNRCCCFCKQHLCIQISTQGCAFNSFGYIQTFIYIYIYIYECVCICRVYENPNSGCMVTVILKSTFLEIDYISNKKHIGHGILVHSRQQSINWFGKWSDYTLMGLGKRIEVLNVIEYS